VVQAIKVVTLKVEEYFSVAELPEAKAKHENWYILQNL
jgi:hypothetical protein